MDFFLFSKTFTPVRVAIVEKTKITNVGEDVEKRKPSYTAGGNVN